MMKQITFLLFFAFVFSACVERGYTLKRVTQAPAPAPTVTESVKTKLNEIEKPVMNSAIETKAPKVKVQKETKKGTSAQTLTERSAQITPTIKEVTVVKKEEESFFSLSDENKKTISGIFIVIIGLIILL